MSKKWVDVDKISSIAGRSKKYTDDKIADLAGTTLDAISDLEEGKQDTIEGGNVGLTIGFDEDGNQILVPVTPNPNILPSYEALNLVEDYWVYSDGLTKQNMSNSSDGVDLYYVKFTSEGTIHVDIPGKVIKLAQGDITLSILSSKKLDAVIQKIEGSGEPSTVTNLPTIHTANTVSVPFRLSTSTTFNDTWNINKDAVYRLIIKVYNGTEIYAVKLESSSNQTLGYYSVDDYHWHMIPQPPRVDSGSSSSSTVPSDDSKVDVPENALTGPAKGPGNVIVYDDVGNTKFQPITPNYNYIPHSIFVEENISSTADWPENWTSSSTQIGFGFTSWHGLSNRPYVNYGTSGTISVNVNLGTFQLLNEFFTISAFGEGNITLYARIEQVSNTATVQNGLFNVSTGATANSITVTTSSTSIRMPISFATCISAYSEDMSDYQLHIGVTASVGAKLYAVKLESGYNQTLAYKYSENGYLHYDLIPQSPISESKVEDVTVVESEPIVTGVNIFPQISVHDLIYIGTDAIDSSYTRYIGWRTNAGEFAYTIRSGSRYRDSVSFGNKTGMNPVSLQAHVNAQILNNMNIGWIINRPITVSALIYNYYGCGSLTYSCGYKKENSDIIYLVENVPISDAIGESILITQTFTIPVLSTEKLTDIIAISINLTPSAANQLIAIHDIKVELGEHSTLCSPGSIIPNGRPGYKPENYLAFGLSKSRTNLLKNCIYGLRRTVNTLGKTTYSSTQWAETPCIDGWYIVAKSDTSNSATLTVGSGSITISSENGISASFRQNIYSLNESPIVNIPITFTIYISFNGGYFNAYLYNLADDKYVKICDHVTGTGWKVHSIILPTYGAGSRYCLTIDTISTLGIACVKLEIGSISTALGDFWGEYIQYIDEYDFGAIAIPQSEDKIVSYNDKGRLVPVMVSPRPNLLKNADWTQIKRIAFSSTASINGTPYYDPNFTSGSYITGTYQVCYWYNYGLGANGNTYIYGDDGNTLGYIQWQGAFINSSNMKTFEYYIKYADYPYLEYSTLTLSAAITLSTDNVLRIVSITGNKNMDSTAIYDNNIVFNKELATNTYLQLNIGRNLKQITVRICSTNTSVSIKMHAMKLEIGDSQTLGKVENGRLVLFDKYEPIEVPDSTLAADVSTQSTEISALKTKTDTTNTNLASLTTRVTNVETKATTNATNINAKASSSALTALTTRVTTAETNLNKKALASDLTALTARVTSLEQANSSESSSSLPTIANWSLQIPRSYDAIIGTGYSSHYSSKTIEILIPTSIAISGVYVPPSPLYLRWNIRDSSGEASKLDLSLRLANSTGSYDKVSNYTTWTVAYINYQGIHLHFKLDSTVTGYYPAILVAFNRDSSNTGKFELSTDGP